MRRWVCVFDIRTLRYVFTHRWVPTAMGHCLCMFIQPCACVHACEGTYEEEDGPGARGPAVFRTWDSPAPCYLPSRDPSTFSTHAVLLPGFSNIYAPIFKIREISLPHPVCWCVCVSPGKGALRPSHSFHPQAEVPEGSKDATTTLASDKF